jgi:hypothetical protein
MPTKPKRGIGDPAHRAAKIGAVSLVAPANIAMGKLNQTAGASRREQEAASRLRRSAGASTK